MKKSNVIIFALLAACSAFLLWLWYFLGFNRVDDPFDLVLSVVWWAIIAVAIVAIVRAERVRRRRVRTVYVGEAAAFNSEQGLVALPAEQPTQDAIASILESLTYDFTRKDFPEKDTFKPKYFVRTGEFEVEKRDSVPEAASASGAASATIAPGDHRPAGQTTWKGEVVVVDTKEERSFDTPEELGRILASLEAAA